MEIYETAKAIPMKSAAFRDGPKATGGNHFRSVLNQVSRQPMKPSEKNTTCKTKANPEPKEATQSEPSDSMENTSIQLDEDDVGVESEKTAEILLWLKKQMEEEGAKSGMRILTQAIPKRAIESMDEAIPKETAGPSAAITVTGQRMFEQQHWDQAAVIAVTPDLTVPRDTESGSIGKAERVPGQALDQSKSSLTLQLVFTKESVTEPGQEIESLQKAYDAGKYQNLVNLKNSLAIHEAEASTAEPKLNQVNTLPIEEEIHEMKQAITDGTMVPTMIQDADNNKRLETGKTNESGQEAILDAADFVNQINSTSSRTLRSGKKEFVIKLKPEGLGEITVRISEAGGKLALSMVTSSLEVEKLLNSQLGVLKEALRPYHTQINSVTTELATERTNLPQEGTSLFGQRQSGFGDQNFRDDQENQGPLNLGRGVQIHSEGFLGDPRSKVDTSAILDQYV